MLAIQMRRFGAPDVLTAEELPVPVPAAGEALVKVTASGLNFSDTLMRQDRYAMTPELPTVLGCEVVGRIARPPAGSSLREGERVAVPMFAVHRMVGGYAEYVTADPSILVPVPEGVSDEVACALQVQGLSALALTRHVPVQGRRVLVTAAAGGVGSLLVQLLRRAGAAQVIAAASTADKRSFALEMGADAAVDYTAPDWTRQLLALTGGTGPDVVFESTGGDITGQCLSTLAAGGTMIVYGALNIQAFHLGVPELKQMIFMNQAVKGFALVPLLTPARLRDDLATLFELARTDALRVHVAARVPLAEAARAHALLEDRASRGKIVLVP